MANRQKLSRREFLYTSAAVAGAVLANGVLPPAVGAFVTETSRYQKQLATLPTVNIGTLGHLAHGKTTLTAAITKVLSLTNQATFQPYEAIANAPEVVLGSVSLSIAYVTYQTANRLYTHSDCPNHRDYTKELIMGVGAMDGVILVVSAPDGPMPQTREHILLAQQAGIPAMVVYINKIDQMDDPELLQLIELELSDLLEGYGFSADTPVIRGSALQALESASSDPGTAEYQSILQLMDAVDRWIPTPVDNAEKPFLMPIEDIFSIKGRGTVVTGQVERGTLTKGEEVEIIGLRDSIIKTMVTGIEMFNKEQDAAGVGDNVGVLLRGVSRDEIERGMVLSQPGGTALHTQFLGEIYVLGQDEGGRQRAFFTGYRPQFHIRTADVTGTIELPEGVEMVMPGDTVNLKVELIAPVALEKGTKFTIREGGLTVGVGIVTETID